jgi:hypothetical protein
MFMSASSSKSSSSREWLTIGAGLAIVVVVIFVISTIGSLNGFYNEFHAAYLEGNCKRAGELYVDFTANPPLFDLSGLTAKIEADWAECKPYADLERLFEYGAPEFVERWVENYEAFVKQYPDSHLVALLKQRVEDKLNNPEESISYPYF